MRSLNFLLSYAGDPSLFSCFPFISPPPATPVIDFPFSFPYPISTGCAHNQVFWKGENIMAIYKISEILESLQIAKSDGYEYVSINESDDDDPDPAVLFLDYLETPNDSESDMIDAVDLPDNYIAHLK